MAKETIHWFVERRDCSGVWHAVSASPYYYGCAWWVFMQDNSLPKRPAGNTDWFFELNHDLAEVFTSFLPGELIGSSIFHPGWPESPSEMASAELALQQEPKIEAGHLEGDAFFRLRDEHTEAKIRDLSGRLCTLFEADVIDLVLPTSVIRDKDDDDMLGRRVFADIRGIESSHDYLERLRLSQGLQPRENARDNLRLLIFVTPRS